MKQTNQFKSFTPWRMSLAAIFALAVVIYMPSLMGYAIWDDNQLIPGTAFGKNSFLSAFTHPFLAFYRPLTSASFVLDSMYARGIPFFYHQTNILLHAITAVLVAILANLLTKKPVAGVCAGVFFALQSMQVGATAWIGGRTDALSTLFLTIYMIGMVLHFQTEKRRWLVGAAAAYLLAALSKEQAAFMLLSVPVATFALGSGSWRDVRKLALPFAVVVAIYAGLWVIGGPAPATAPLPIVDMVALIGRTAIHYIMGFAAPNTASQLAFTVSHLDSKFWIVLGLLSIAGVAWGVKALWRTNRDLAWIAICGLTVYLPVSNLPPVPSFTVAPYRVSETGVSVACLLGIALATAISNRRIWVAGLTSLNLLASIYVTWWGTHLWLTSYDFFEKVGTRDSHFIYGVQFYATELNKHGKTKEAYEVTDKTLAWIFGTSDWTGYLKSRRSQAVDDNVRRRLRVNGGRPQSLGNFIGSQAYYAARLNRMKEAKTVAQCALEVQPFDPWVNFLNARLIRVENRKLAIHYMEVALSENPDYSDCAQSLAHERLVDQRYQDAVKLLVRALKIDPNNGRSWVDLAQARIHLGDFKGAKEAIDQAEASLFHISKEEAAKLRLDVDNAQRGKKP